MKSDYKSISEQATASNRDSCNQAKSNVEQLSSLLDNNTLSGVHAEEGTEKLKDVGVKGMIAATAAASVMGITSMMHPEKAGEATPVLPIEPAPIEQVVETPQPAFNLEDGTKTEEREMTFVKEEIETRPLTWWHDVPTVNQRELIYNSKNTDHGCAPTAVSMITEYWHQQDPDNKTSSAQELLDANVEQGIFDGDGMSVTYIHDELSALGYEAQDYADSDLKTLKHEVAKGPVVAAVKLGMGTAGNNHSVVVTGISENNDVRINDPWTGESCTYSWETFNASWGTLGRWFTTVKPT